MPASGWRLFQGDGVGTDSTAAFGVFDSLSLCLALSGSAMGTESAPNGISSLFCRARAVGRYLDSMDTASSISGSNVVAAVCEPDILCLGVGDVDIEAVDGGSAQSHSVSVLLETECGRVLCRFAVADTVSMAAVVGDGAVEAVIEYKAGQSLQPPVLDVMEQIVVRRWTHSVAEHAENAVVDAPDSIFKHRATERPPVHRRRRSKRRKRWELELGSALSVEALREVEALKCCHFGNEMAAEIYNKMTMLYSTMRV